MAGDSSGVDKALQNDVDTVKRMYKGGNQGLPPIYKALEAACWGLAGTTVIMMLFALPFVGQDKVIPGEAWLTFSLISIGLFGGIAFLIRLVTSGMGAAIDSAMDSRLD